RKSAKFATLADLRDRRNPFGSKRVRRRAPRSAKSATRHGGGARSTELPTQQTNGPPGEDVHERDDVSAREGRAGSSPRRKRDEHSTPIKEIPLPIPCHRETHPGGPDLSNRPHRSGGFATVSARKKRIPEIVTFLCCARVSRMYAIQKSRSI